MVQPAMPTKRIALDDLPLSFTTPLSVSTGSLAALRGTRAIAMQRSHGSQLAQTGLEGRVKALNSSPTHDTASKRPHSTSMPQRKPRDKHDRAPREGEQDGKQGAGTASRASSCCG
jgi:hypothetical protein